jgi:GT2 family glycosyltransferase
MSRVSVITVAFQSAAEINEALESARCAAREADMELELIVVDNASADGSADTVAKCAPDAVLIRNRENVGFGRANNQAFEIATGQWWVLLNPDARLEPDALRLLVDFIESHPRAAAVAPAIAGGGAASASFAGGGAESCGMLPGLRSAAGHFLFLNRLLPGDRGGAWRGFQLTRRPRLGPRPVQWASAAALLVRPAAVRAVGGFDPAIFLYGEDVEIGERLGNQGWQIWLLPEALAWHRIASSQGGVSTRWVDSLHIDMARHAGRLGLVSFDVLLAVGLLARALAARGRGEEAKRHRRRMAAGSARALRLSRLALLGGRAPVDSRAPGSQDLRGDGGS